VDVAVLRQAIASGGTLSEEDYQEKMTAYETRQAQKS
jgi:hypothetical protein